jgi:hypothetical protein
VKNWVEEFKANPKVVVAEPGCARGSVDLVNEPERHQVLVDLAAEAGGAGQAPTGPQQAWPKSWA